MQLLLFSLFGVALILCALLSGAEASLFALSRLRVRQQMRSGDSKAAQLHTLVANFERFLRNVLGGKAVAEAFVVMTALALITAIAPAASIAFYIMAAICAVAFYVFLRLTPKLLFRLYPNRLTIFLAPLLRFLNFIFQPAGWAAKILVHILSPVVMARRFTGQSFGSRDDLRLIMQETPSLTEDERAMIYRVLDMQNLTVQQISIPMSKVTGVELDMPIADILVVYRQTELSRMPVWKDNRGQRHVLGVIDLNTIIFDEVAAEEKTAADYMTRCLSFDSATRLEVALREMQRARQRIAVVTAPDGAEIGIVGLEDILKAIFGEVSL